MDIDDVNMVGVGVGAVVEVEGEVNVECEEKGSLRYDEVGGLVRG